MLLIIDNQNAFIKQFIRDYIRERNIPHRIFRHNEPINPDELKHISGLILSGGRGHPYASLNLTADFVCLNNLDVPVMGFCLGHEIISVFFGGQIEKLPDYYTRKVDIQLIKKDPIFKGINKETISLARRHSYHVSKLPPEFNILGYSPVTPHEIIRHNTKPIYGFQGHPEVSPPEGYTIMDNFIRMCGLVSG